MSTCARKGYLLFLQVSRASRSSHVNVPPLRWFHNILAHPVRSTGGRWARGLHFETLHGNVKIVCGSCHRSCVACQRKCRCSGHRDTGTQGPSAPPTHFASPVVAKAELTKQQKWQLKYAMLQHGRNLRKSQGVEQKAAGRIYVIPGTLSWLPAQSSGIVVGVTSALHQDAGAIKGGRIMSIVIWYECCTNKVNGSVYSPVGVSHLVTHYVSAGSSFRHSQFKAACTGAIKNIPAAILLDLSSWTYHLPFTIATSSLSRTVASLHLLSCFCIIKQSPLLWSVLVSLLLTNMCKEWQSQG